jgi:hypothetical protein
VEVADHGLADLVEPVSLDLRPGEHRADHARALLVDRQRVVEARRAEVAQRQRVTWRDHLELSLDLVAQRVDVGRLEHLAGDFASVDLLEDRVRGGVLAPIDRQARLGAPEAALEADAQDVERDARRVLRTELGDGTRVALETDGHRHRATRLVADDLVYPAPEAHR